MKKNFNQKWWHKSVVYQIYPKSFNDTTGSGEGDIRGIIEKLDYLKELGVEVIWITPMYKSPQNDNGYDISDYYDIDPNYGTMADFEEMLAEAHKRAKLYSASDFSSREEAGREAMRLCRNNGNTDCKIIYRVKNGCFAAAEGMTKNGMFRLHFGADTSPSMAETQAMDLCVSAGMKDCMLAQKAECSIARPPR